MQDPTHLKYGRVFSFGLNTLDLSLMFNSGPNTQSHFLMARKKDALMPCCTRTFSPASLYKNHLLR